MIRIPNFSLLAPLLLATLAALTVAPAKAEAPLSASEGRRIEVLFLGDDGGHKPAERFPFLYRALGPHGINLTYTDQLQDLNDATLARYDVVAIYANHAQLDPERESALLKFVRAGHGLVAIHCASACFGNSAEYRRLIGGRFLKHESGVFRPRIVDAEHELMKALPTFEAWDETYVHDAVNPDRHVLQQRDDEPWTWVRNEGAGRVFYTASGHDEQVWKLGEFHELIERAIKWSAGPQAVAALAALKLQPLEYYDGPPVQNYEKRNPPPRAQRPLTTEEAAKHMHVPADMELSLVASEPDLWKTLDIKFDERGRMWTCETRDFPNDLKPQGEGGDRIRLWESTRNDGHYDKVSVFATGLSIPCSVLPWQDGVIVLTMPDTLFLRDTKGIGIADKREVLFSGWGTGDTHFGPSHLTYGFDGWIYGSIGADSFNGVVGGEKVNFSACAMFRFKPDGSKLERLCKVSNNIWAFAFNEDGDIFGSTANNQSSVYLPIPERYYLATPGLELGILPGVDANKRAPYMREYIRQVDVHGGFTSAASHMFYTARAFPQWYWNRVAFINEPTAHIVYRGVAERQGADFRIKNGWNLLASDDEWFAPVFSSVGPDGAVYVSDFYSFIMQHGPPPVKEHAGFDAPLGKGGAFISPLRSTDRARLWRVAAKDAKPSRQWKLSKDDPATLLEALRSDNLLWRQHAQRLLVERGKDDVAPQLRAMVGDRSVDAVGVNGGALHALWTLHLLGAADMETIRTALSHPAAGVRRAAAEVMPRNEEGLGMILSSSVLKDSDARVRLRALLAVSEMPRSEEAGRALYALASDSFILGDRWLPDALTIAAARHGLAFLRAALADPASPTGATPHELAPKLEIENADHPGWKSLTYAGKAEFTFDAAVSHSGRTSMRIASAEGADASWQARIPVEPQREYRLTAWMKCENLARPGIGGRGALVNVRGAPIETPEIIGTTDWKRVTTTFNSEDRTLLDLNLLFGGGGKCMGTAWWDDVSVTKVDPFSRLNGILRGAATAWAATAKPEELHGLHVLLESKSPVAEMIASALFPPAGNSRGPSLEKLAETHQILKLTTAPNLQFEPKRLQAQPGKPIAIVFENPDLMLHNLVVGKPGTLQIIGQAANALAAQPEAIARSYVPALPEVLASSPLINPHGTTIVILPALAAGDYPFLCTFPGHWMLMQGSLNVQQ